MDLRVHPHEAYSDFGQKRGSSFILNSDNVQEPHQ